MKLKIYITLLTFLIVNQNPMSAQLKKEYQMENLLKKMRLKAEEFPIPENSIELEEILTFPSEELADKNVFLYRPIKIINDSKSNIYVVDNARHMVFKFDRFGKYISKFGQRGQGPGDFMQPFNIIVRKDSIIISEVGNMRIQFFNSNGHYKKSFKVFRGYFSMALNKDGLICGIPVNPRSDPYHLVNVISQEGKLINSFGNRMKMEALYNRATIAVNEKDEILVAFTYFPIIRIYSKHGDLLAEHKIYTDIIKAKEKNNKKMFSLKLAKKIQVPISMINCGFRLLNENKYIYYNSPRIEILEIDKDWNIKTTYWMNCENVFTSLDFLVLEENNQKKFYILENVPGAIIHVLAPKK